MVSLKCDMRGPKLCEFQFCFQCLLPETCNFIFKPSLDLPRQIRHSHASSDFSYADLGGGGGLDAAQKQHQQLPNSPKPLAGRKRSFTQACTWDNLGPKALSEISASLLAGGGGSGGWEGVQTPPTASAVGVDAPGSSCSAVPPSFMADSASAAAAGAAAAAAPKKQEVGRSLGGHNRKAPAAAGGCSKGRRGAGAGGGEGAGKRPLNPERMERKASREKRRREEVRRQAEGQRRNVFCVSVRALSSLL